MPVSIYKYDLTELSHEESKNVVIIGTTPDIEIEITRAKDRTVIKLPFKNRFDLIDRVIIIHDN